MSKWIVEVSEGYGWEEPGWTPRFDTKEEAWEFIVGDGSEGQWDGQVRTVQLEDEEEDDE